MALRPGFIAQMERIDFRLSTPGLARPHDEADYEKMARDLVGPPFPPGSRYLYDWFRAIASGRQSNGFSPLALESTEIESWSRMSGHQLTPWEFDTIRKLDLEWRSIYTELHKPDPPAPKPGQADQGPRS